jgi:hypothetical protein
MAVTNFSPLLGLALPTTGDLSGTWGATVNDSITSLIDSSVAGTTTLSADADVTLSTTNGSANQARNAVILWTASNGATTRNITAPAQSKAYVVINAGTGSIVIRGSGPTTGVTIASGTKALVAWNGSDFVSIAKSLISLTSDVTGTLPIANGGTGTTSTTFTNLATNVTGVLPLLNGGTGVTTPSLVAGTNVTITGTWPNQTVNASGGGGGGSVTAVSASAPLASSGGTSPDISLTGVVPIANGGTNSTATPTAGGIAYGTGTANAYTSAGTAGYFLQSNGASAPTWVAFSGGGLTNVAVFGGSGTWSVPAGITRCKVTVTGGGGGAGAPYAGGSGGTAIGFVTLSGGSATITVGAGGASGSSGTAGTSSFVYGATTLSATGGGNGQTGSNFSPTYGGSASGGDINIPGAGGGRGLPGASSFWGGGGTAFAGGGAQGTGGGGDFQYGGAGAGNGGIVVIEY